MLRSEIVALQFFGSYSSILASLQGLDEWLSRNGLTPKNDRIHRHIRNLESLNKAEAEGKLVDVPKSQYRELLWSLAEGVELTDIFAGLRDVEMLAPKIKLALQGPHLQGDESSTSNVGRNTMFELTVAARFLRAGLRTEIGQENPDVIVHLPARRIFIQCKRPLRKTTLKENVLAAAAQLTRDLNNAGTPEDRGVVAISLSRIIAEQGEFLIVSHQEGAQEALQAKALNDLSSLSRLWKKPNDERIVGMIFHHLRPIVIRNPTSAIAEQGFIAVRFPDRDKAVMGEIDAALAGRDVESA